MATNIKHVNSKKYNKALSFDDRNTLANIIATNRNPDGTLSLKLNDIANMLEKDPTTLSKEVKNRRTKLNLNNPAYKYTSAFCKLCANQRDCEIKKNGLYGSLGICHNFKRYICKHLTHFPWCCNGCSKKGSCGSPKSYYNPQPAHDEYLNTLQDSRIGICMTAKEFEPINSKISEGLKKGQSIEHIVHSNDLKISVKTAYNYLHNGYFNVGLIDTHRIVRRRFKTRENKPYNSKILKEAKEGRHYEDFTKLILEKPDLTYTQMDTVEGVKGGKVLLSLKVVKVQLQLFFLLDKKSSSAVVDKLNEICNIIGIENFKRVFGTILSDNGTEFSDINGIMFDDLGELKTEVYFCHPNSSWEKGSCERSHELLRYILPKGSSFNSLTDEVVNLINSNINSYIRKSTDFSSPIEKFRTFFGSEILDKLGISLIEPNKVLLTKELIQS